MENIIMSEQEREQNERVRKFDKMFGLLKIADTMSMPGSRYPVLDCMTDWDRATKDVGMPCLVGVTQQSFDVSNFDENDMELNGHGNGMHCRALALGEMIFYWDGTKWDFIRKWEAIKKVEEWLGKNVGPKPSEINN